MDPYETLGVSRGCTRAELQEAFRAKARLAHPDRGGESAAFIRLRQAYDQILPRCKPMQAGPLAGAAAPSSRLDRRPKPPDPNWEPDLILLDEEPRRTRPPKPPDPNWEPDLILLDEEPRPYRFPASRDDAVARQNYDRWLGRLLAKSQPHERMLRGIWFDMIGLTVLLSVIMLITWICWAVWSHDPQTGASEVATPR